MPANGPHWDLRRARSAGESSGHMAPWRYVLSTSTLAKHCHPKRGSVSLFSGEAADLWQHPPTLGHRTPHPEVVLCTSLRPGDCCPQGISFGTRRPPMRSALSGCLLRIRGTMSNNPHVLIVLTKQVARPSRRNLPGSQHKTTAEAMHTADPTQRGSCGTELCALLSWPAIFWQRNVHALTAPPKTTTPCLSVGRLWSPFHTTALGSATLAALKMPSQPGGHRPFQICVFPECNEIPARVHNWCPNSRCATAVRSGCETK